MLTLESGLTITNSNFSLVLSSKNAPRVVLAVPHDGLISNDFGGMFKTRQNGVKGRDVKVWPVANDILQQSLKLGVSISAIRFLMSRAYVDANREMPQDVNVDPDTRGQTALDDILLSSVYEHYHGELCRLVESGIEAHGLRDILFVDLHGFGKQPTIAPPEGYDLILGTANRTTMPHSNVDIDFAAYMEQRGYRIFLPRENPVVPMGDPFSAGHTTRWYAGKYNINAMQIEIFSTFRRREGEERGRKLASDMAEFIIHHYR